MPHLRFEPCQVLLDLEVVEVFRHRSFLEEVVEVFRRRSFRVEVVEVFRHPLHHQNHLVVEEVEVEVEEVPFPPLEVEVEEVEEVEVPLRLLGQMEEVSGLSFVAPN